MKLVLISDTHGNHTKLGIPPCDVLVHCGDFSNVGTFEQTREFLIWMEAQPAERKILVPWNHDIFCEKSPELVREMATKRGVHFLIDERLEIDGLKFWGSPYTPTFFDWSFMEPRGPALRAHWSKIPDDTDILITHGPPQGIGDATPRGEAAGCADLLDRIMKIQPKVHVFGHIHEGRGEYRLGETRFINAASIGRYLHPPIVVEVE